MLIRKRNKKLENDTEYDIFMDNQLEQEMLEPFKQNIATGMELEEEKEQHLRTVINQGEGEIPVPIVKRVEGIKRSEFDIPKEYIKWEQDCKNTLVLTSTDIDFLESHKIEKSSILNTLICDVEDDKKKEFLMKKSLRLLNTEDNTDSYICFRKRILKNSRKSRRSETNINERIKRIWNEFNVLKKIYELHLKRCELEDELLDITNDIICIGMESEDAKKKIIKKFKKKKREVAREFYKECGSFFDLRKSTVKIKMLKELILKKDPKINSSDFESEVKAYENYRDSL